jgi:hypothetical protein
MPTGCPSAGTAPGVDDFTPEVPSVVVVDELLPDPTDDGVEVAVEPDADDEDAQDEGRDEEDGDEVVVDEDFTWVLVPASSCSNCWRSAC